MKSKNYIFVIGIIIIIILIIGAVVINNNQNNQEKAIKIGVILPLTGFLANPGQDTKNAIEQAYGDLNATNIELIYEDDACDSTKALSAYKKLVEVDKVNFIIGPFCGQSAITVLPDLNQDKVVAISPGAPDNELSKENDYFFRTRIPNKDEVGKIIDFLDEKNITKVALYTAKNTFGKSYHDSFINQFRGKIVYDDGSSDYQTDFKTDIIKIKTTNPEAVFLVPASRQQMGIFVKQMKELGFSPLIVGGAVTEQQDLLDAAGSAADGIIYPYVSPKNDKIVNEYIENYKKNPSMEVLNGYDAFNILYNKIKDCNSDKECVRNKLNNLKDFQGVMGNISFDKYGDAQVDIILKTIKNGEFVPYES